MEGYWQAGVTILMIAGAGVYLAGVWWSRRRHMGERAGPECADGCCGCPHARPDSGGDQGCAPQSGR